MKWLNNTIPLRVLLNQPQRIYSINFNSFLLLHTTNNEEVSEEERMLTNSTLKIKIRVESTLVSPLHYII